MLRFIAALTFSVLLSGCSFLAPRLLPFDNLPPPTGEFSVGTQIYYWTDAARDEWFTENPNDKRRLVVQVWYPTLQGDGAGMVYVDQPEIRLKPLARQMGLPKFLIQHIQHVETNSHLDAAPQAGSQKAPLILFSHGLGGMRTQNTVQVEELVSRGYVVVAVDHPFDAYLTIFDDGSLADYRSGANGKLTKEEFWAFRSPQLATRTADMAFLLDEISKLNSEEETPWSKIDLNRVGIFGHSYGGATSIMAAATDGRIKASIALDGWTLPVPDENIEAGLTVPFLYIGQSQWDDGLNYEKLDALIDNSEAEARVLLLDGTKHMDFSDSPQFSKASARFGISGKMPREELRERLNAEIIAFFDANLGDGE